VVLRVCNAQQLGKQHFSVLRLGALKPPLFLHCYILQAAGTEPAGVRARQLPAMAWDSHLPDRLLAGSSSLMLGLRQRLAEHDALAFESPLYTFCLGQLPCLQCIKWGC
jgi:hypothetical protein